MCGPPNLPGARAAFAGLRALLSSRRGRRLELARSAKFARMSGARVTLAEVIGFSEGRVLLMPYGDLRGIALDAEVAATGMDPEAPTGAALLGRVIDGFGMPLDSDGPLNVATHAPPLSRAH